MPPRGRVDLPAWLAAPAYVGLADLHGTDPVPGVSLAAVQFQPEHWPDAVRPALLPFRAPQGPGWQERLLRALSTVARGGGLADDEPLTVDEVPERLRINPTERLLRHRRRGHESGNRRP